MNDADRFFAKVMPHPSGCLIWTGGKTSDGYGVFYYDGKTRPAHRFLLERVYGRNEGLVVDHLCRTPACVRPTHLEFVTFAENIRRGHGGALRKAKAAERITCARGHSIVGDNLYLYVSKEGRISRICKQCQRDRSKTAKRRAWAAAYARRTRANRGLLRSDQRILILEGANGPQISVRVVSGDTKEMLDATRDTVVAQYKATRAAIR